MLSELHALDTGRPALRRFGLVVGPVLLAIGGIVAWRSGVPWAPVPAALIGVGTALVVGGALSPGVLRWPYVAWMALALALGFVMTRVILTLVYLVVVTPVGLVMRLAGRDPMHRRPDPTRTTYWIPKDGSEDPGTGLTRYW